MTVKLHKIKDNVYSFNTQEDNPDSPTYADTDYLASRYNKWSSWLVSSSNSPTVLISEHPTLTSVKEHYSSC